MESGKRFVSNQVAFVFAVFSVLIGSEAFSYEPCPESRPRIVAAANEMIAAASQVQGFNTAAASAVDGKWLKHLDAAATERAKACRKAAKFLGGAWTCGNRSKGMCSQATRETLNKMKIPMPRANAADQQNFLNNPKYFEKIAEQKVSSGRPVGGKQIDQSLCNKGDPGIVCLYTTTRHRYGHIEVKSANGRFCSDFCSTHASNMNRRGAFTLVGVYRIKPQQ